MYNGDNGFNCPLSSDEQLFDYQQIFTHKSVSRSQSLRAAL